MAILDGTPEKVRKAVRRYDRVGVELNKFEVTASPAGGWRASVTASVAFDDGSPLHFRRIGDRWRVDKRLRVPKLKVGSFAREDLLAGASGELVLRSPETGIGWLGAEQLSANLEPSARGAYVMKLFGDVELDPETFAAGGALPSGAWQFGLRVNALGTSRHVAVRRQPGLRVPRRADKVSGAARLRFRRGVRLALVVNDPE